MFRKFYYNGNAVVGVLSPKTTTVRTYYSGIAVYSFDNGFFLFNLSLACFSPFN